MSCRTLAGLISALVLLLMPSAAEADLVTVISVERSYSGNANAVPLSGPVITSNLSEMGLGLGSLPQVLSSASSGDGTTMTARGESALATMVTNDVTAQIVLETISGAARGSVLTLVPAGNVSRATATVRFRSMINVSSTTTGLEFASSRFVFGNITEGNLTIRESGGPVIFSSNVDSLPSNWTISTTPNTPLLLDVDLESRSFNDFSPTRSSVDFDNQRLTLGITAVPEPSACFIPLLGFVFVAFRKLKRDTQSNPQS